MLIILVGLSRVHFRMRRTFFLLLTQIRQLNRCRTISCFLFGLFHGICRRLGVRLKRPLPVRISAGDFRSFFMRPGRSDWSTFQLTLFGREYAFVTERVPDVKTIFDWGANIGDSTWYFADAYPDAIILAVEPDEMNMNICRMNIESGGFSNRVTFHQVFVGDQSGVAGIDRSGKGGDWAYKMNLDSLERNISIVTAETLFDRFGVSEIDLLKCDIEGAEQNVFKDCHSWIRRVRHIAIETCPPYSIKEMAINLRDNGGDFVIEYYAKPDGFHELALFSSHSFVIDTPNSRANVE